MPPAPQPQLTKQVEETLLETNKDKVLECIKTSNVVHDLLDEYGVDKNDVLDFLYADTLFKYQLATFLFKMKILAKKRLEEFIC